MPKVSFRMASASRESVFAVQTNTARKNHRSDHTEGRRTVAYDPALVWPSLPCRTEASLTPGRARQLAAHRLLDIREQLAGRAGHHRHDLLAEQRLPPDATAVGGDVHGGASVGKEGA